MANSDGLHSTHCKFGTFLDKAAWYVANVMKPMQMKFLVEAEVDRANAIELSVGMKGAEKMLDL